jgi:CheY-like chemotaxis protein
MDIVEKLLQAISAILWPLIVIFLIFCFRPAVAVIIESARSRKFTLKIGGQELTMEEANQVQQSLIKDLQTQVAEIQKKLDSPKDSTQLTESAPLEITISAGKCLLWADDNPKNNSYFIEQLTDLGIRVDLALSTAEAKALFEKNTYRYVLSDMGRLEQGRFNPVAGIELLKYVREKNKTIPFVIFCSSRAVNIYKEEALMAGATAITSSPTELSGILNLGAASAHM